ncbi:hypothetical protein BGY98DRAFT_936134 [Russula aff. rugulosa BPL654]|nr:hypothetical protein BGY98DRAFT_936134 [Russula aff. rugulosa BPL654]
MLLVASSLSRNPPPPGITRRSQGRKSSPCTRMSQVIASEACATATLPYLGKRGRGRNESTEAESELGRLRRIAIGWLGSPPCRNERGKGLTEELWGSALFPVSTGLTGEVLLAEVFVTPTGISKSWFRLFPRQMSMAMAGQGLVAGPPPRLAYHSSFGQNPDKKQPWNSLLSSKRFHPSVVD